MSTDQTITLIPVEDLHDSPFNPRQTFDAAADAEMVEDIKAHGRILQPLLVRPRIGPLFQGDMAAMAGYELIFGHRRKRNAITAGLAQLPCMVETVDDATARRMQISENLQRDDVHPIEEAQGFQALIDDDGETADTIAAKFGKSRSYVYGRLKLLALVPEVRKACLAKEVDAEVALLIARLRVPKLQEKALGYIKAEWRTKLDDGGKASYRAIRDLLNEKFTLGLDEAMFDIEDEMLVPAAGHCLRCPKRSGNAPEFDDVAHAGDKAHPFSGMLKRVDEHFGHLTHRGPNVCTDPDCFDAKKKAHLKREADKLAADGKVVVTGNAARSAISAHGDIKGSYIALKDVKAQLKKAGQDKTVQVVLIQDPRTSKTHQAVKVQDVKAAGVKVKEPAAAKADSYAEQQKRWAAERAAGEAKAKVERDVRLAVLDRIAAAMAATPRDAFDLQLIARAAWAGVQYHGKELLCEIRGFRSATALEKTIGQMDVPTLTLFMMQCALANDVAARSHDWKSKPEDLLQAAAHYGIDVNQVRTELATAGASTPSPAARAPEQTNAAPAGAKSAKAKGKPKKSQKDNAGDAGGSDGQVDAFAGAEEANV